MQERRPVAPLTSQPAPPRPSVAPTRRLPLVLLVAATATAVDQVSKSLALAALGDGAISIGFGVRLDLHFNSGAAFSFGEGRPSLFAVLAFLTVVGIGVVAARSRLDPWRAISFGLLMGGALGNALDRVVRGHDGRVVDFVDLGWWPVFNLADVWLTFGVVILLIASWRGDE